MKKSLLLLGSALLATCFGALADTSGVKNYTPGYQVNYYWSNSANEWRTAEKINYEYYPDGKLKSERGNYTAPMDYIYDDLGRLVQKLVLRQDGDQFLPYQMTEYTYDTVITDQCIAAKNYQWNETTGVYEPLYSGGWEYYVRRDDNGMMTRLGYLNLTGNGSGFDQGWVWYWDMAYDTTTGQCNMLKQMNWIASAWTPVYTYHDMVWETTDGQFFDLTKESADNAIFGGRNKVLSSQVDFNRDVPVTGTLTATYSDVPGDYEYTLMARDTLISSMSHIQLDNYGSYTNNGAARDDFFHPGYADQLYTWVETYKYNEFGFLMECFLEETDESGALTTQKYQQGTLELDSADMPYEYIMQQKYEYDDYSEWHNSVRRVYTDYPPSSSVNTLPQDELSSDTEWFTLQGLRVKEPASGLYIKRTGGKTTKVMR